MARERTTRNQHHHTRDGHSGMQNQMCLRFGAMILTGMVVMYWVMFVGSWERSHVRWSQSRMFMALTMRGTMGLNGRALTSTEADARQIPDFDRPAARQCPAG